MDLFAPPNLPGVGMGDLSSVGGFGGLVGVAATSGALIAARIPGLLVFLASAVLVLLANDEQWGGTPIGSGIALALVAVLSLVHAVVGQRGAQLGAVLLGGASVGYAWAEWDEGAFSGVDTEAIAGIVVGVLAAAVAGWAAERFVGGSIRAGATALIVGSVVAIVAFALNTASFYVPFVGFVVPPLAAFVGMRLGRRDREKYKGLRILS